MCAAWVDQGRFPGADCTLRWVLLVGRNVLRKRVQKGTPRRGRSLGKGVAARTSRVKLAEHQAAQCDWVTAYRGVGRRQRPAMRPGRAVRGVG